MKRLIASALVLSAALMACNTPAPQPTAIRFFNAVPDSIGMGVDLSDVLITPITTPVVFRAAFPSNSTYRSALEGTLDYSLCPAEDRNCPAQVKNRKAVLSGNKKTTFVLIGTRATNDDTGTDARLLEALTLSDDTTAPVAGKARIRVVHVAPVVAAKNVDLFITAPDTDLSTITTPAQISYKGTYDYRDLNAGSYRIRLTAPGVTNTVLVDSDTLVLEADKTYTAVLTNPDAGNSNKGVTLLTDK
jgi:hypothetical protein